MEKIEIVYKEYIRLVERHDKLLDSSFEDFRLYAVIGSLFTIIVGIMNADLDIPLKLKEESIDDLTFLASLFTFLLISLIAARDLLKHTYITHLAFNIKKIEQFIRDTLLSDEDKYKYEIFNLRKSWIEKYFPVLQKSYSFFVLIFFLIIAILPITLFILSLPFYGIILCTIVILTMLFYSFLLKHIYSRSKKYEAL
jgi:hypothetical protein